jgi:hypothetical protein
VSKQKVTVLFFNSYGDQVGCDDIPYPPGTVYVQLGIGDVPETPHGSPFPAWLAPGEELFSATEVRHIGVRVEPLKTAIIFGADDREILPGEERPLHPLTSQCRCGRQITKLTSDGAWAHSD